MIHLTFASTRFRGFFGDCRPLDGGVPSVDCDQRGMKRLMHKSLGGRLLSVCTGILDLLSDAFYLEFMLRNII
jgi:hypothetical protein